MTQTHIAIVLVVRSVAVTSTRDAYATRVRTLFNDDSSKVLLYHDQMAGPGPRRLPVYINIRCNKKLKQAASI